MNVSQVTQYVNVKRHSLRFEPVRDTEYDTVVFQRIAEIERDGYKLGTIVQDKLKEAMWVRSFITDASLQHVGDDPEATSIMKEWISDLETIEKWTIMHCLESALEMMYSAHIEREMKVYGAQNFDRLVRIPEPKKTNVIRKHAEYAVLIRMIDQIKIEMNRASEERVCSLLCDLSTAVEKAEQLQLEAVLIESSV